MASNLQSGQSLVGLCHGQGSPLLAGPLSHSPLCHNGLAPAEADTSAFVAQCPEEIHDLANERVVSIFAFNCLQARHWVREDYDIVLCRIHVPIIVQCQCDCCCLSSKDGTVIWESFGQLAASRVTILEMAVDDRCCLSLALWIGLDWICLTTTHVLQDILAVLHKWMCLGIAFIL